MKEQGERPIPKSGILQFLRGLTYFIFLGVCVEVALQGFYYVAVGDFLFRRVALPIYAREPRAGFGNRPGLSFHHRTNEFHANYYVNQAGFRVPRSGVEYTLEKPPNTYRVMLLGPSFAFGWGVDYELSFAGVLQQLLCERGFAGGRRIEIINAGIPAMPPGPQLVWFETVGKHYLPDLVIQFVYGSMAVDSASKPTARVDDKGYLVSVNPDERTRWRERLKKLATVFYGWILWTEFRGQQVGAVLGAGRDIAAPMRFDPKDPDVDAAIHFYNKLAHIVSASGAQLLVVYFPLSYAVHRDDESRWRHLGIVNITRQMAFDVAFVRHLNARQIPSIDLTQELQKSAGIGNRNYFWLDIHWTPAGNATAARAVANYLMGVR